MGSGARYHEEVKGMETLAAGGGGTQSPKSPNMLFRPLREHEGQVSSMDELSNVSRWPRGVVVRLVGL
jgi:hypothetical protein